MYTLNGPLNRVATQIKQIIGRRNLVNRELGNAYTTLLELLGGNETEFRAFLRNELGFTKSRLEAAWSLVNLFILMPNETLWKSVGQSGLQKLLKLSADDRRGVVRWVTSQQANTTTGYVSPTLLNDRIIGCASFPAPKTTKPVAERDALLRLVKELVEEGKLSIDDVPLNKTVHGRRVALKALVGETLETVTA